MPRSLVTSDATFGAGTAGKIDTDVGPPTIRDLECHLVGFAGVRHPTSSNEELVVIF